VDVMPEGPADKAGIQKGDIITHVNGVRVRTEEQFLRKIWEIPIDTEFEIALLRKNTSKTVKVRGMDFYDFYDLGGSDELLGH
jgi:S1-C subfamily serine protease